MRRLLILLLLAFPLHVQAAPKWLKRSVQVAVYAAPIATSLWATHEGSLCRQRNDVAFCSGGYGSFNRREYGVRMSLSVTTGGLSLWGHKQGFKEWFAPAAGMAAFNSFVAIHEAGIHTKEQR